MSAIFSMKFKLSLVLCVLCACSLAIAGTALPKIDKAAYYHAIASGSREEVNNELETLQTNTGNEKEAYEGALLMKKAGLVALPKDKLKYFKAGRIKLETAIQAEPANAEYRFLRLIIEEHAPKIVKYKADIPADAQAIKKAYKGLPPVVQQAVQDYSKSSKALNPQDF